MYTIRLTQYVSGYWVNVVELTAVNEKQKDQLVQEIQTKLLAERRMSFSQREPDGKLIFAVVSPMAGPIRIHVFKTP